MVLDKAVDRQLERKLEHEHKLGDRIAAKAKRAMQHIEKNKIRWPKSSSFSKRARAAITRPGVYQRNRPKSASGAQSFHFSFTTVSRGLDGTRAGGRRGGESAAHAAYIEREGAAEVLKNKKKDRERDLKDPSIMQDYIEREGAAETLDTPENGEHVLASFGNIANTYDERLDFWKKLEQAERSPNRHYLHFDYEAQPDFWKKLKKEKKIPSLLLHADGEQKKVSGGEKEIKEAMKFLEERGALGQKKAVSFEPGRGGRVQNRIIIELPYELKPKERLALAKKFCGLLEEKNLPYWAVIHAPDHHNDRRNYHMHIAFAERPAARMIDPEDKKEKWDFEIIQIVGKESKHARPKRVFRQPKDRDINSNQLIKKWRGLYAKYANEAFKKAGIKKKLDPRRYTEMGINLTPVPRLTPKEYQQEKKGAAKPENDAKILAQWQREIARLDLRIEAVRKERAKRLRAYELRFDALLERASMHNKAEIERAKNMFLVAEDQKISSLANIEATRHVMARIQSRTIPPLEKSQFLKKDTDDFARTWAAKDIKNEKEKIEKADARSRAALTYLVASERADSTGLREKLLKDLEKSVQSRVQADIAIMNDLTERAAKQPRFINPEIIVKTNKNQKSKTPDFENQKIEKTSDVKIEKEIVSKKPEITKEPVVEKIAEPAKPKRTTKQTYLKDKISNQKNEKKDVRVEPMGKPAKQIAQKPKIEAEDNLIVKAKTEPKKKIKAVVEENLNSGKIKNPENKSSTPKIVLDEKTSKKDDVSSKSKLEKTALGKKPKTKKKSKKERDEELRRRALIAQRLRKGIGH